jgi:hypothetical protein
MPKVTGYKAWIQIERELDDGWNYDNMADDFAITDWCNDLLEVLYTVRGVLVFVDAHPGYVEDVNRMIEKERQKGDSLESGDMD